MGNEIKNFVFKAITINDDYIENMLEIHRILDDLEKHKLMLTENGIVKPIIPKKEEPKHVSKNIR